MVTGGPLHGYRGTSTYLTGSVKDPRAWSEATLNRDGSRLLLLKLLFDLSF